MSTTVIAEPSSAGAAAGELEFRPNYLLTWPEEEDGNRIVGNPELALTTLLPKAEARDHWKWVVESTWPERASDAYQWTVRDFWASIREYIRSECQEEVGGLRDQLGQLED